MSRSVPHIRFEDIQFESKKRVVPHAGAGILENEIRLNHPLIKANERVIDLEGIHIVYRDWQLPGAIKLETRHEKPFLKMQFELEGHSDFRSCVSTREPRVTIPAGTHMLLFFPELKGNLYYERSRKVLDISFTVDYIKRLFGGSLNSLGHFGRGIEQSFPVLIDRTSRRITPAMRRVIQEILRCPYEGIFKKIQIESRVMELLNLQLDAFRAPAEQAVTMNIHREDLDKFLYLRELIHREPGLNYSLLQLAEKVGLNDFKLKRGFKQLFGNTVFGYLREVRMEKSLELLQEGGCSVHEVAYQMGYKYPQHFSKAFKAKFGFLPGELKS